MKIHEYQGKAILREYGVPVPNGDVAELYLSMTLDRGKGTHVVMASQAGGMEIEEVAATHPDKIIREWTDPALGLQPFQARNLAFGLGLSGDQFKAGVSLILNLFRAYIEKDGSLAR